MRKTVFRGIRQSLKRLSDASTQVVVTVDNITKSLTVSSVPGQWHLPFEWVLDNDAGSFDMNSQRGCVISPQLTQEITAVETKVVEREGGQLEVVVEWDKTLSEDTKDLNGSVPSSTPSRSAFVFSPSEVAQTITTDKLQSLTPPQSALQLQTSRTLWKGSELYDEGEDRSRPPSRVVVKDFFADVQRTKCEVVRKVEQFGFAVAEDSSLSAVVGKSTTAVVQKRYECAERMIRHVFPVLRNSHYGAMSTWSDSDAWKQVPLDMSNGSDSDGVAPFCESASHLDGAYLSSHLDLHTDGTYFIESPKLQSYGCIFTTPSTFGGETTIADGFATIQELLQTSPEAVALLSSVEVGGRYRKEGLWYEAHRPVVSFCNRTGHIKQISFNNADRIPMSCALSDEVLRKFYQAYHKFHKQVHSNSITFQLKPGQMLFFDNHRALHGRKQFAGPRVMCGAYVGLDDYFSSLLIAENTK